MDVTASLATLARNEHVQPNGMLKLAADLDRYMQIIEKTQPEVMVETGTRTGQSALWFARQGLDVVTVDILAVTLPDVPEAGRVTCVTGDSVHPAIVERVRKYVGARRAMVSLDSDHSASHVMEEILLYGPLVSAGCYLVVEDGIFGHADAPLRAQHGLGDMVGSPLDAILQALVNNPRWSRDLAIEGLSAVTHHLAGFWRHNG